MGVPSPVTHDDPLPANRIALLAACAPELGRAKAVLAAASWYSGGSCRTSISVSEEVMGLDGRSRRLERLELVDPPEIERWTVVAISAQACRGFALVGRTIGLPQGTDVGC